MPILVYFVLLPLYGYLVGKLLIAALDTLCASDPTPTGFFGRYVLLAALSPIWPLWTAYLTLRTLLKLISPRQ